MIQFCKNHPKTVFVLFIMAYFFLNRYEEITVMKPYSVHQWRQDDCYAITANYYENNLPFLEPSVNQIGFNGNGKTISEFPIIYYTVSKLWHVFGKHAVVFRVLNLLILFAGLYSLFQISLGVLKNVFLAIFVVGLTASSPLIAYYGNNFLADVPAFSLALCAWYFFYHFYKTEKTKYLIVSAVLFLLAGLVKITSIISIAAIMGAIILEMIGFVKLKGSGKLFAKPLLQIIPFAAAIVSIYGWVQYAKWYNAANSAGVFLTGIWPYWEASQTERVRIFQAFYERILFQFHSPIVLVGLVLANIYSFYLFKKNNPFIAIAQIVMVLGFFSFFILFFNVFDVHDYYLSNWVIIIPVSILSFFFVMQQVKSSIFRWKWVTVLLVFIFVHSMYYGAALTRTKYFENDPFSNEYLTFKQVSRLYHNWFHYYYKTTLKACETVEPYLRSIGIKPTDIVISIPDQSINITLVAMNQIGFTDYGYGHLEGKDKIDYFIDRGAKYLIINDQEILTKRPFLQLYTKAKKGTYQNITIYELKKTINN
jgi:hypothetical protein